MVGMNGIDFLIIEKEKILNKPTIIIWMGGWSMPDTRPSVHASEYEMLGNWGFH